MKAPRNKTIDLSVKDGKEYLDRCLTLKDAVRKDQIKDLSGTITVSKR